MHSEYKNGQCLQICGYQQMSKGKDLSGRNISCSASIPGGKLDPEFHFQRRDIEEDSVSPSNTFDDSGAQSNKSLSQFKEPGLDTEELLYNLEARYDDIFDSYEYSKDLPTYLQYCKDIVFDGLEPPHDDHEETRMIELFGIFIRLKRNLSLQMTLE
ncbi:uncharacterized protein LOC123213227 [Mangifera indica]|uniref:uncharacterized protein LOC123213227 n=1 Tax=Mangifera indica TaxID=29780 RepID=UPI001CFAEF30|nr:uncharacterized protein LOC123213227 [Mangifera indica]XP_044488555.1 uncharacterized protein LOC123213227 [Mangifera indica]